MSHQYYLMAQLPSLDGLSDTAPLPITEDTFYELCARYLSEKESKKLQALSLAPPRDCDAVRSPLLDAWNRNEAQLRLALGSVRAAKMKKSFDPGPDVLPVQLVQAARTAAGLEDPLSAERYLNQYRLGVLDQLRPMDAFCEDAVFYYGLKLKLLLRIRQFDADKGREAYRNIYASILSGGGQENE